MAMYPDRDGEYMMTEPGSYVLGGNKNVVRIIMHQTWAPQTILNQAPINYREWTRATAGSHKTNIHSQFGVSAHFTVEADGRIFQHVDTDNSAKGTSEYASNSVHVEFAARDQPLTNDQLFYGAALMAWIASVHTNVKLIAVGTSNKDPGDLKQAGITCHSFVEIVGKAKKPKLDCPGKAIVDQMLTMGVLASVRATFP